MLVEPENVSGALGGCRINQRPEWVKPIVRDLFAFEAKSKFSACPAPRLPRHVETSKTRHGKTVYYFRRDRKTPRVRIRSEPGTAEFEIEVKNARSGIVTPKVVSWVYFVRSGDRVKIGVSRNPRSRLGELRIGSSRLLRLSYVTPGDISLERQLHREFGADRVTGEWFIYSRQIRDWIAKDELARLDARNKAQGE